MKTTTPTAAELEDHRMWELVDAIPHDGLHAWVRRYLFAPTWIVAAYWGVNAAALLVVYIVWRSSDTSMLEAFPTICLGMVMGYVLLLPIHEIVHAGAYRLVGASNVRIRYDLRRTTALCIAPGEVLSGTRFLLVCLAPALLINPILAVVTAIAPVGTVALGVSGALLLHIGACSGDIAFVNYLWLHRGRQLYTLDDATRPRTAFYRMKPSVHEPPQPEPANNGM
ncbi:MAG TPA: DUF3267 domain-containing protein [Candidatus Eisenbacteria bacterium]|nr:DUF3267 domain-containing protein [Candidatus Eisenbacteria bacterium]